MQEMGTALNYFLKETSVSGDRFFTGLWRFG